jgi:vacuolar-type H+-ATPase subunit D/Vma8
MSEYDKLLEQLKQKRDELKVQMHLASRDASDEWEDLEKKMQRFREKAELKRSGQEVEGALDQLGKELKEGYQRLKKALND